MLATCSLLLCCSGQSCEDTLRSHTGTHYGFLRWSWAHWVSLSSGRQIQRERHPNSISYSGIKRQAGIIKGASKTEELCDTGMGHWSTARGYSDHKISPSPQPRAEFHWGHSRDVMRRASWLFLMYSLIGLLYYYLIILIIHALLILFKEGQWEVYTMPAKKGGKGKEGW